MIKLIVTVSSYLSASFILCPVCVMDLVLSTSNFIGKFQFDKVYFKQWQLFPIRAKKFPKWLCILATSSIYCAASWQWHQQDLAAVVCMRVSTSLLSLHAHAQMLNMIRFTTRKFKGEICCGSHLGVIYMEQSYCTSGFFSSKAHQASVSCLSHVRLFEPMLLCSLLNTCPLQMALLNKNHFTI